MAGYLKNWNALSSMITRGRSFSGFERNCAFLNTGAGRAFADVSAVSGLDFDDDGRGLASVDWDGDGDLDLWTTNRGAPRVRFLKNNLGPKSHVAFQLRGTRGNRDAIGAILELSWGEQKLTRSLRAGEAFMSQSSKRIHFGLGDLAQEKGGALRVRWPGGRSEVFAIPKANSTYSIVEGSALPVKVERNPVELEPASLAPPIPTEKARIILSERVPTSAFDYVDFSGELRTFRPDPENGSPVLINLWASWCSPCVAELADLKMNFPALKAKGLSILALTTEAVSNDESRPNIKPAKKLVAREQYPFQVGATDANGLRLLTLLQNQNFARERPLPLPTSFLIDRFGRLAAIYKGSVKASQLLADVDLLEAAPSVVFQEAFPFASRNGLELFPVGDLNFAQAFQAGGYLDDARRFAKRQIDAPPSGNAATDAANRARAWYYLGTLEQSSRNWAAAAEAYRKTVALAPDQAILKIPLGVVLWQNGEKEECDRVFAEVAAHAANNPKLLDALGKAHLQLKRPKPAIRFFEQAVASSKNGLAYQISLAIAHEKAGDPSKTKSIYRELIDQHPESLDARNNLAYLLATCPDETLRDGKRALAMAMDVMRQTGNRTPATLDTLAAAQAETGDFKSAVATIDKALRIARETGVERLVKKFIKKRNCYKTGKPFRTDSAK